MEIAGCVVFYPLLVSPIFSILVTIFIQVQKSFYSKRETIGNSKSTLCSPTSFGAASVHYLLCKEIFKYKLSKNKENGTLVSKYVVFLFSSSSRWSIIL